MNLNHLFELLDELNKEATISTYFKEEILFIRTGGIVNIYIFLDEKYANIDVFTISDNYSHSDFVEACEE